MQKNINNIKKGMLIRCSSAEDAVAMSEYILDEYNYFTDFKFNVDGKTGVWLIITYRNIPFVSTIIAKISDFRLSVRKLLHKAKKLGYGLKKWLTDRYFY